MSNIWIPFAAGLEDGLNPCALVSAAVFLLVCLKIERKAGVFLITLFATNLALNIGILGQYLGAPVFLKAMIGMTFVLAAACAIAGGVFLYDWLLLLLGRDQGRLLSIRLCLSDPQSNNVRQGRKGVIALGIVLGLVSSAWPMNYYMSILANDILAPGRFWGGVVMMALYTLVQLWLLYVLAFVFLRGQLTPRLRLIICAAVFLSAAGGVICIF